MTGDARKPDDVELTPELWERLLSVEEDRANGKPGYSVDQLDSFLSDVIETVAKQRKIAPSYKR